MCQTHTDQNQYRTFPATFGAGDNFPLCCYGNTGFVVFSLPLTWADVSKYILVRCVQPLKPRARSNLLEAPFAMSSLRTIRLLQTQQKINKHTDTHSWAQQAHKSPGMCNCAFRWLDDFVQIAAARGCPAVFAVRLGTIRKYILSLSLCELFWAYRPYDCISSFMHSAIKRSMPWWQWAKGTIITCF